MGFATPWFLAGLLAVGLPVWLHLLRKHKSEPVPFSSLMFFERRTQSSIRQRRLYYLLLLSLRALLLVLLAFAFAGPFIKGKPAAASGARTLVVAMDESFSMRQGDRMSRARREAESALSRLRGGERAQVIAFAGKARLLAGPSADQEALRAAVASVAPGSSRSSYGELARGLRALATSSRQPLEVHLISDFQKTSLPASFADSQLPAGATLVPHPVADSRLPNWTVESVTAPRRLHGERKGKVQATVAGFGTPAATVQVSLALNGKVLETRRLEVPAGGRGTVEFPSLEAPYGFSKGEIRLEAGDAFAEDDKFLFAVERSDPRPVLLIHEAPDTRSPLYYRAALEAAAEGAFVLERALALQVPAVVPAKYSFVVLSNVISLPRSSEEALEQYVKGGGSLLIALGPSAAIRGGIPVFGGAVLETRYASREGQRFLTAAVIDVAHPAIRRSGGWEGLKFYQVFPVEPGEARVVARTADQAPLLLEKRIGAGRVLLFCSTFDNISNDFPLHPAFVTFVGQSAHYLSGLGDRPPGLTVDAFLELRAQRDEPAAVEVTGPDGRRALTLSEAASTAGLTLDQEGFYEVRRSNDRNDLVAVNPDRRESDFEQVPPETLSLWEKSAAAGVNVAVTGAPAPAPQGIWWPLLLAAFVLALAESFVAGRYLTPKGQTG